MMNTFSLASELSSSHRKIVSSASRVYQFSECLRVVSEKQIFIQKYEMRPKMFG